MEKMTTNQAVRRLINALKEPKFKNGRHIPLDKAAAVMGKSQQAVREGLKTGILPIGCAIPSSVSTSKKTVYTYYISPKLFWEYTGVLLEGEPDQAGEQ